MGKALAAHLVCVCLPPLCLDSVPAIARAGPSRPTTLYPERIPFVCSARHIPRHTLTLRLLFAWRGGVFLLSSSLDRTRQAPFLLQPCWAG